MMEGILIALAGAGIFAWMLSLKPAPEVSGCVACGSDEVEWDLGHVEGPIDDVYVCRVCGHMGGPGQEYRSRKAELKRWKAKNPDAQWATIVQRWRDGHQELVTASQSPRSSGGDAVLTSWMVSRAAGIHHIDSALTFLAELPAATERKSEIRNIKAELAERPYPDRCVQISIDAQAMLGQLWTADLHTRDCPFPPKDLVLWLSDAPRHELLTTMRERIDLHDLAAYGERLREKDALSLLASMQARREQGDASAFEAALVTLLSSRGDTIAQTVSDALGEVGTGLGLAALEAPPKEATARELAWYRQAAGRIRERLGSSGGRLSIHDNPTDGALSVAGGGELSEIEDPG